MIISLAIPIVISALFMRSRSRRLTSVGTALGLFAYELATGRMPGIMSLPFACAAAAALALERFVMLSRGLVRTVISASVMTFGMIIGSTAVAAFLYGRGEFLPRLAIAMPPLVWWAVPVGCTVVIGLETILWRGGTDNAAMP